MTLSPELAIRMRRATFNAALAEGDLTMIGTLLAPGAILVTGTDSALLPNRKAQLAAWKQEFKAKAPTLYVRTPDSIQISPVEPVAMEVGHWQASSPDNRTLASGSYSAKWREVAGAWMIEAEIYVTLA
ncbi:nuclear transport factor 2 family protein [Sphingobium sp.]|uniref:nuclear transport factor 2 family protein n=1 Tax=Sphingobium sp. TaxID=1912891 RepID=UPI003BB5FD18